MNQLRERFSNSDAMPMLWAAGILAVLFIVVVIGDAVRQRVKRRNREKGK